MFQPVEPALGSIGVGRPFLERAPFPLIREDLGYIGLKVDRQRRRALGVGHGSDEGSAVRHPNERIEQTRPLHEACFHGQVGRSKFITAPHEVLETAVRVAGSLLHPFHGQAQRSPVGQGHGLRRRQRVRRIWQVGVPVHTRGGVGEPLEERERFGNEFAAGHGTQPFDRRVFGQMTAADEHVEEVALLVDDGSGLPVVPQPHGRSSTAFILTLPPRIRATE